MIENHKELVEVINHIYLKHENDLNEVDFNLFELFSLRNSEVLHSLFIAELLNPLGKHKQGDIFLRLFIEVVDFPEFKFSNAGVSTERFAGYITENYGEGGRIDICVENNQKQAAIIENKIYAGDQYKQLIRYCQYADRYYLKYKLYYLTLFGNKPSKDSYIDENINLSAVIQIISYQKEIKRWIENCIIECKNASVIETLKQYLNTIKRLTNQTTNDKMKEEIKLILTEKIDYFNAFEQFRNVTDEIRIELAKEIVDQLNLKLKPIYQNNEIKIFANVINDGDGFQLAFWAHDNFENDISQKDICKIYIDNMTKVVRMDNPYQFSGSPICWLNFSDFYKNKNLKDLSSALICSLYNINNENILKNREEFYEKIECEIQEYIFEFKKACNL